MARSEILAPFIRSWEGGFSNHPNDRGGATNKGITIGTFRQVFGRDKTVDDLKALTDDQWMHIYKTCYWDCWKADLIVSQSIANLLADWCWASGGTGVRLAQQVLGVAADGIVGPVTLQAVNAADASQLFAALWKRRRKHFEDVAQQPGQEVFLKGWMNRLNSIKYGKLVCNTGRRYMGRRQRKVITWPGGILKEEWEYV